MSVSIYETLRILLVSGEEDLRDQVTVALQARLPNHRVYWVSQADTALRRAEELVPHLIILSDDLRGATMASMVRDLTAHAPGASILVLIEPGSVAQASQAMLAGARGFVIKPLSHPDEFVASVRELLRQGSSTSEGGAAPAARPLGRVLVFCAPKGGTGRTTLAINTAVSLREETKREVALVDADFAAPALDVALNLQPDRTIADLLPRLARLDSELIMGVLARHTSGLHVLLAPAPNELPEAIPLPQVQQIVATLRRSFDWVVVDLGLPMNETAYAFLDSADRIVISVLPEMVGLRNARLLLDGLNERGYPEDKVWLLVNRSTMAGGVKQRDIEARLKLPISFAVPDDQPLATHSINRGVPVLLSHERSALARSYRQFAKKIIKELPLLALPEHPDGNTTAEAQATVRADAVLGDAQPLR